jgi:hypothetical protein
MSVAYHLQVSIPAPKEARAFSELPFASEKSGANPRHLPTREHARACIFASLPVSHHDPGSAHWNTYSPGSGMSLHTTLQAVCARTATRNICLSPYARAHLHVMFVPP